jgi:hypothetical protein
MKKQALSFFFFIMLNLALARDGSLGNQYKFSANIETDLSKNKINFRNKTVNRTLLVGELSIGTPEYCSGNSSAQNSGFYNCEWYKIRTRYNGDGKTGYIWNIPIKLLTAELLNRGGPPEMLCYGITSLDMKTGFSSTARIIRERKILADIDLNSIYNISGYGLLRHSIYLNCCNDPGIPGINKILSLTYHCGNPDSLTQEIILLWNGEKMINEAKIHGLRSKHFGFRINYYLS